MSERQIGVTINGATGRMGTTQHMANLLAIAAEGGLALRNGDRLIPDLLLVGRDAGRLKALSAAKGNQRWTTNLDEALAGPDAIFMDCAATGDRPARVRQAIAAGKHIHIEKPTAPTVEEATAARSPRTNSIFPAGDKSACTASRPSAMATASAEAGRSPLTITSRVTPAARRARSARGVSGRIRSASSRAPATRPSNATQATEAAAAAMRAAAPSVGGGMPAASSSPALPTSTRTSPTLPAKPPARNLFHIKRQNQWQR